MLKMYIGGIYYILEDEEGFPTAELTLHFLVSRSSLRKSTCLYVLKGRRPCLPFLTHLVVYVYIPV